MRRRSPRLGGMTARMTLGASGKTRYRESGIDGWSRCGILGADRVLQRAHGWREIANRHVVDQPPTQRGHLGHHRVSCLTIGFGHRNPLRQELLQPPLTPLVAERLRCVPGMLNSSEVKVLYPT